MTPITPPQVHDRRSLLMRDLLTAFVTTLMLFSWAFAAHNLAEATKEPDARLERLMLAACRLPDREGALTMFTVREGKIECRRYQ